MPRASMLVPRTRMGLFTAFLVVLWIAKSLLLQSAAGPSLGSGVRFALDLLSLGLVIPAVYYAWKLFTLVRRKFLWKIRRRLILAHMFIGAIPVLIVIAILYVSALLVYYQLSYYLIMNQIGIHIAQIHALNLTLREGIEQGLAAPRRLGAGALLDREGKYLLSAYPKAAIVLRVEGERPGEMELFGTNVRRDLLPRFEIPSWVRGREFQGLVVEDREPELFREASAAPSPGDRGKLHLRSFVSSETARGTPFVLEVSVPLDQYLLDRLKSALGLDLLLADHVPPSGMNVMLQSTELLAQNVLSATFDVERDAQQLGRPVWSILLVPTSWTTGEESPRFDTEVLFVELSSSRLMQNVFRESSDVGRTILWVLKLVVGFFLAVEVASVIVGIVLTKSITSAVHNLDRGTGFVRRGDFSHRIVVKSDDQLGSLARSFNQMTEYVQELVRERVLKERLERELEIAREVQEQLFPRQAPRMERMELVGHCLPARVVSGDYYDFLGLGPQSLAMALGDICGKGISAALLMANLQATLRSNIGHLTRGSGNGDGALRAPGAVAEVVRLLNDQIYAHTAANKFASFFYAVYDEADMTLTYCNAGHNPPLYFARGGFERLHTGGTVVGIFPSASFEDAIVHLAPGDLLLAYTDGIVESVNEWGEEFGEARLIELVGRHREESADEIQKAIVDRVLDWTFEEERDDDMTILVAKIR